MVKRNIWAGRGSSLARRFSVIENQSFGDEVHENEMHEIMALNQNTAISRL